jgi:hypothetical protein
MRKIYIRKKYYGEVELPQTKYAKKIFFNVINAFSKKETITMDHLFPPFKIKSLAQYQKGGALDELDEIELFLELGQKLGFNTTQALALKNQILSINDLAHTHFNIKKRLQLFNKEKASQTHSTYLFWDIENVSTIGPVFNDIIEAFEIEDEKIYLAANPDSLYLYGDAWESEFYDYGKRLKSSFNFTKCDHGKNVADEVLLENFKNLNLQQCDIYIITYDRELKELFLEACHSSNNLYIVGK